MYYRIGDVARQLDVEPHVVRHWESEFRIRPLRSKKGQRVYAPQHLGKLRLIKWLLYTELFTVEGARRQLKRLSEFCS